MEPVAIRCGSAFECLIREIARTRIRLYGIDAFERDELCGRSDAVGATRAVCG